MRFQTFSTSSLLALLVVSSSALSFADVVDKIQENIIAPIAGKVSPDAAQIQYPCCIGCKPSLCPSPQIVDHGTVSISINGTKNFRGHPAGCGKNFAEESCLFFLQSTLDALDIPLGIAAKKAGCEVDEKPGCGAHSSPGACLKFLHEFLYSLKKPIENSVEYAGNRTQEATDPTTEASHAPGESAGHAEL